MKRPTRDKASVILADLILWLDEEKRPLEERIKVLNKVLNDLGFNK